MKLDPVSLKLFIAVVEAQGIGRAAERECIAAAAISKRITDLENTLGTQLLTRSYKGVEPTAAGSALLRLARQALHSLDEVHTQMLDYAGGTRGQVRLFANISAITQFLLGDLAKFAEKYPEIRLHLEERNSAVTLREVAENGADVGIYTRKPHGDEIATLTYEVDELAVILRRDHPLAGRKSLQLADLLDWDFVGLRTGSAINSELTDAAARTGRPLRLRMQVTGYDALCLMVSAGLGIAIAPSHLVRLFDKRLNICEVKLAEPWAHRELGICVRAHAELPNATSLLVKHLQQCANARKP